MARYMRTVRKPGKIYKLDTGTMWMSETGVDAYYIQCLTFNGLICNRAEVIVSEHHISAMALESKQIFANQGTYTRFIIQDVHGSIHDVWVRNIFIVGPAVLVVDEKKDQELSDG